MIRLTCLRGGHSGRSVLFEFEGPLLNLCLSLMMFFVDCVTI